MDLSKLDKLIHEKARLGIMSLLVSRAERWTFQDLKSELKMSDGISSLICEPWQRPTLSFPKRWKE
jgi:hypothetical protein